MGWFDREERVGSSSGTRETKKAYLSVSLFLIRHQESKKAVTI